MPEAITDEDLEFVRELIGLTQASKVDWTVSDEGGFATSRPRVTAVLERRRGDLGGGRQVRLVLRRRGSTDVSRVLEQQIDAAEPHPIELAMNSLLAFLWQLVADRQQASSSLYHDFLRDDG
jgi:hypothetical protein